MRCGGPRCRGGWVHSLPCQTAPESANITLQHLEHSQSCRGHSPYQWSTASTRRVAFRNRPAKATCSGRGLSGFRAGLLDFRGNHRSPPIPPCTPGAAPQSPSNASSLASPGPSPITTLALPTAPPQHPLPPPDSPLRNPTHFTDYFYQTFFIYYFEKKIWFF